MQLQKKRQNDTVLRLLENGWQRKQCGSQQLKEALLKQVRLKQKEKGGNEMPNGKPRSNTERLKRHFGANWKKHKVSELPKRGAGRKRPKRRK